MNRLLRTLCVAGAGAGLMYFYDPQRGRARRARAHDKVASAVRHAACTAGKVERDIHNRWQGIRTGHFEVGKLDLLQKTWSPATRFIVGCCALGMGACASLRGGLRAMIWDAVAAGLLVEAVRDPHRRSSHGNHAQPAKASSAPDNATTKPRWKSTEMPAEKIPLARAEDVKQSEPLPVVQGYVPRRDGLG
jgi:hypothetical protein